MNTTPAVAPCIHPRCNDGNGNPQLTTLIMCDPCRRHYRRELEWLVLDYVTLKTWMPSPVRRGTQVRHIVATSFGHPAQWASDNCALIADSLTEIEDGLRESLGSPVAPPKTVGEAARVNHAYQYLRVRFTELCTYPIADGSVVDIHDLHQSIRKALGMTAFRQRLPMPCPSCDLAALFRYVGQVECDECGRIVREEDYPMLTRIALDALIDAYDTRIMQ